MGKLFGTDGARGVAITELTCELAMNIGRAAAVALTRHTSKRPRIVIGKDTRLSSDVLEAALCAGICSVGADAELLGVVPTPAVAYLVRLYDADAGVMISASHNTMEYNGIKLFSKDGFKLSDEIENEIEAMVLEHPEEIILKEGREVGSMRRRDDAQRNYVRYLTSTVTSSLKGMRVVADCANGSASTTAHALFEALGADCVIINATPDGVNINEACGSLHIDTLARAVQAHRAQLGVAFDGDADRCLAVDENGTLIDGDKLLAIFGKTMKTQDKLKNNTVVATVMSNMGFFRFARDNGMEAAITKVGDRYVLEEMLAKGYNLGGEQSGHIIFLDHATTGDGQLSAIQLMACMKAFGRPLSELGEWMERYPQVVINVKVTDEGKAAWREDPKVMETINRCTDTLGNDGRVLVRASGTEPLIRVMVEGKDFDAINESALAISAVIRERCSA